jgi:hypothetical protein
MLDTILLVALFGITATRVHDAPVIDGLLTDECWAEAEAVTESFTTFRPRTDQTMSSPVTVSVIYDEHALYLGLLMHDPEPCLVNLDSGVRDEDYPSDRVHVYLDTFGDQSNCYMFAVSAGGVQIDARRTGIGGEDRNWDAVWSSAVSLCDSGWTAEIAIPFSVLRYAGEGEQNWGINLGRTLSRTNEGGYLFRMGERGSFDVSKFGALSGLCCLPENRSIEWRPFLTGRVQHTSPQGELERWWGGAGLDARVPLSNRSVLDLSFYPDFGQIESDSDQGNITHWDPWLSEKRPFFMEGSEVFDMPFHMFYSRNMGSVASTGGLVPIIGGAKLTGSSDGFRYGALSVVTGRVPDSQGGLAEAAASWFAGSALHEFNPHNWVKLSATSVDIPGQGGGVYDYGRSSALSGMVTPWNHIHITGKLGITWNRPEDNRNNHAVRLDAGYFPDNHELNFRYERKGEGFNPGYMGYFQGNGQESFSAYGSVSTGMDSGVISGLWFGMNPSYTRDTEGRNAGSGIHAWAGGVTTGRYDLNLWADWTDRWFDRYEGPDGAWYPGGFSGGISSSTDYRKQVAGWASVSRSAYLDSFTERFALGLRLKPVPELFVSIEPSLRLQDPATRYNSGAARWESTDSDWRSLDVSATVFLTAQMRMRLSGQLSRFERNWETEEFSRVQENLWGNLLYSWEYAPGSFFHFLAGREGNGEEPAVLTLYAKLTRFF